MGIFFNKAEIIFPQSLFHYQNTFPTFVWDIYGCVKLYIQVSELFMHTVFLLIVVYKTLFLEFILQGVKEMEFGGS